MFHDIPQPMLDRMKELEQIDARDRVDGTIERKRLLQVPPETGKFIALLAAAGSGRSVHPDRDQCGLFCHVALPGVSPCGPDAYDLRDSRGKNTVGTPDVRDDLYWRCGKFCPRQRP